MNYRDFNLDDWIGHISGVIEDETTLDGNEMRDLVEFLTTLKQYPTTKNDLGVDCISRQELLKIYEDRFTELQKLKHLKDNKGAEDRQMGVNYCINILKELPPVTLQEPRCRECKWWKDSDGKYRRGIGSKSQCPMNTHAVYYGDGYCYKFSPKA